MVTTWDINDFSVTESDQLPSLGFWRRNARRCHRALRFDWACIPCGGGVDLDLLEREEAFLKRVDDAQVHTMYVEGEDTMDTLDVALALSAERGVVLHEGGASRLFVEEVVEQDVSDTSRVMAPELTGEPARQRAESDGGMSTSRVTVTRPVATNGLIAEVMLDGEHYVIQRVVVPVVVQQWVQQRLAMVQWVDWRKRGDHVRRTIVAAECVRALIERRANTSVLRRAREAQLIKAGYAYFDEEGSLRAASASTGSATGNEEGVAKVPGHGKKRKLVVRRGVVVDPAIVAGVKLAVVAKIGHRPDTEANRLVVETVARRVMLERKVHPQTQAIYLQRIVEAYFVANNYNAGAGWYRRKLSGWRSWIAGTGSKMSAPGSA